MPTNHLELAVLVSALSSDPRAAPRVAREMGIGGLQFDAYSAELRIPELSATGRREFRHVLAAQDRRLASLRFDLDRKGLGLGADVDRVIARAEQVFHAAAELAAPLVCIDLGALPAAPATVAPRPRVTPEQAGLILIPSLSAAPPSTLPAAPPPDPEFVSQVDHALKELGIRADRYSVVVALRSSLADFAALERALRAADCPWFGVDLDPVALVQEPPHSTEEIFARLGPLIRHVTARDAVRGTDHRTKVVVPGAGETDWAQLLALLDDAGYRGWVTLDPTDLTDRRGAVRESAALLRRLL